MSNLLQCLKEEIIETTTIEFDNGSTWALEFILQSAEEDISLFGVKINRLTLDGELVESDETFATTEKKEEALAMLKAFAKGKVLPMSLLYMVDDWEWEAPSH